MTVTLYSTPTCGTCKMASNRLEKQGVEVKKIDLTEHPLIADSLKERLETSILNVPLFEFQGEIHNITGLPSIIQRATA